LNFDAANDVPPIMATSFQPVPQTASIIPPVNPVSKTVLDETTLKAASIDAEYEMIIEALKQSNFNKSKAAKLLNIDRKTLYNKMKQYQELNNH
jgi:two-component system response regulator HydG